MKLSAIETLATNISAGAWVRDNPVIPGLALKVRGESNVDAQAILNRLVREVPADRRRDGLSDADSVRIGIEVAVGALLIDWDITDEDGVRIACTVDKARDLLTSLPPLRDAVAYASRVVGQQGAASLESDVKN